MVTRFYLHTLFSPIHSYDYHRYSSLLLIGLIIILVSSYSNIEAPGLVGHELTGLPWSAGLCSAECDPCEHPGEHSEQTDALENGAVARNAGSPETLPVVEVVTSPRRHVLVSLSDRGAFNKPYICRTRFFIGRPLVPVV